VIAEDKCIDCGLCKKVCNFTAFVDEKIAPDCYAVRHKDESEVRTSRSGAAFMALADFVLEQNGVVFGAEFSDPKTVIHKSEKTKDGVNKFKGSKYVKTIDNIIGDDTVIEGKYEIDKDAGEITFTYEVDGEEKTATENFSSGEEDGVEYIKIGIVKYNKVK
jgi:ferredoxin